MLVYNKPYLELGSDSKIHAKVKVWHLKQIKKYFK